MKLALRYIPTEVWVDVFVFPWISRKKLGKIVDRFRNRKFAEILQYCLHERGKRTLGHLELNKHVIIPLAPLPNNIKFFDRVIISHFDSLAIDFLCRISTLFLSNDVNLFIEFGYDEDDATKLRTVLDYLAPLLHGIHSIYIPSGQLAIPIVEQYFSPKLTQVKMLTVDLGYNSAKANQATINFCLNWLNSDERDPDEPRFLKVYAYWEDFQQFCNDVQQQFLLAKRMCTFAIEHAHDFYDPGFDFRLDLQQNNLGEQLHGEFNEHGYFQILRHPVNFARTQLEEWVERTVEKRYASSVIELCGELTIVPIDAKAGPDGVNEDGAEDEDQPSTSKRPKLA